MQPLHAILILTAFCAMSFSYGHSMQHEPEQKPKVEYFHLTDKPDGRCLASAVSMSQLMAPQSRSHKFPMPKQFAQVEQ